MRLSTNLQLRTAGSNEGRATRVRSRNLQEAIADQSRGHRGDAKTSAAITDRTESGRERPRYTGNTRNVRLRH